MLVSVVIPAYNEEKLLPLCLDCLVAQKTKHQLEVIVVNNNSTDHTQKVIDSYQGKMNLVSILEKRKGRGRARHTGFENAQGSIILSTDADAFVPPDWVERMVAGFSSSAVVAVTGPSKITDLSVFRNFSYNFVQPLVMRLYSVVFRHYWLSGYNFGIRKSAYQKTTGFNYRLLAQEDIDLGFKVRKIGKIVFLPTLPVVFSGRRFNKGLLGGFFPYLVTFFQYLLFNNQNIDLKDVRD